VAQIQARKIEVDGLTTAIAPMTIESACDKFLADAKARQLREASLRKYRQLFKQLKAYSDVRGIALLNNFTTDELLTFRSTWENSGGTEVRIPVHPDALEALNRIPKTSPYFFWSGESKRRTVVNIWEDSFKAMFKRAEVVGHSHQLRHTFAVDLLQRGTSLEHVSSLLGHKNLKITQKHYSAFTPGRRDALEEAVRAAWKVPSAVTPHL